MKKEFKGRGNQMYKIYAKNPPCKSLLLKNLNSLRVVPKFKLLVPSIPCKLIVLNNYIQKVNVQCLLLIFRALTLDILHKIEYFQGGVSINSILDILKNFCEAL